MPRGGKRQGTPGVGYSNRTDLAVDYTAGSPASGGMVTQADLMQPSTPPVQYPEDSPMLLDPTQRPDEPVTAGLENGPLGGPKQAAQTEAQRFKAWLPLLEERANSGDASPTFVMFVKRLRGA